MNGSSSGIRLGRDYQVIPDLTYHVANNWEAKLDLYLPAEITTPPPVLIHYHGGGWVSGDRKNDILRLLPYLEQGFAVVNVSYRLARVALAPAAAIDAVCAFRWLMQNAETYQLDRDRIVLHGGSAGGHLALMAGLLPADSPLTHECPASSPADKQLFESIQPAAIINWFGITNVNTLLREPNPKSYALRWIGGQPTGAEIARMVSPLNYVRSDIPPILTIHGNLDSVVPYPQAVTMHKALDDAGVDHQLITVEGGDHGKFSLLQQEQNYAAIWQFLKRQGAIE